MGRTWGEEENTEGPHFSSEARCLSEHSWFPPAWHPFLALARTWGADERRDVCMQWPLEEWALDGLPVDTQGARGMPVPRGLAQTHALPTPPPSPPLWDVLALLQPGPSCGLRPQAAEHVVDGEGSARIRRGWGGQPGRAEDVDGSAPHAGVTLVRERGEVVWT